MMSYKSILIICFISWHWTRAIHYRLLIDQSHRYGRPQAAYREPVGSYDKATRTAICFEHKTQYLLIRDPYTRIVVFWHISNIPPMISQSQISCNTPSFYIAAILVKTQPAVGCYNSWANLRSSDCYPLGEKLLWSRYIHLCRSGQLVLPSSVIPGGILII